MRFDQVENIWSVDMSQLANSDRGQIYFARAKWVIAEIIADPKKRSIAIRSNRISRSHLVRLIGCRPGAIAENPHIRRLVNEADEKLARMARENSTTVSRKTLRARVDALEQSLSDLRSLVIAQRDEIDALRKKLSDGDVMEKHSSASLMLKRSRSRDAREWSSRK